MIHKHHILIVDDDADDREIIRDAFMSAIQEQEYVFLENGEKLLSYLDQHVANQQHPFIILLDLNMPGKDGRETLRELKGSDRFRHIPAIVFTTSSATRDKEMAYALGANCFITKPDTFNELVQQIRCVVRLWLEQ